MKMNRFDWAEVNGKGVLEDPYDDALSSMHFGNFNIFVLDRESGIVYSGAAGEGTGSLANDVKTFVEG